MAPPLKVMLEPALLLLATESSAFRVASLRQPKVARPPLRSVSLEPRLITASLPVILMVLPRKMAFCFALPDTCCRMLTVELLTKMVSAYTSTPALSLPLPAVTVTLALFWMFKVSRSLIWSFSSAFLAPKVNVPLPAVLPLMVMSCALPSMATVFEPLAVILKSLSAPRLNMTSFLRSVSPDLTSMAALSPLLMVMTSPLVASLMSVKLLYSVTACAWPAAKPAVSRTAVAMPLM